MASFAKSILPPLDGSLSVVPGFVDFRAEQNPSDPCYVFASSDSSTNVSVSYLEFFQATHRMANALGTERTLLDGKVVAIVVNCDTLLFEALFFGLARAGFIPFPMSPRNSAPALASMCQRTDCHRVVTQPAFMALINEARGDLPPDHSLNVDMLPEFHDIFPDVGDAVSPTVFAPTLYVPREQMSPPSEIAFYLHSSGSTGFPKPIPQPSRSVLQFCSFSMIADTRNCGLKWGAMALPPFHLLGTLIQIYCPFVTGLPVALFAPNAPAPPPVPTPENTLEAMRRTGCNAAMCMPTFLEAYAQDEASIEFLATLKFVTFAGGPLAPASGAGLVKAGVNLHAMYGMTEAGPVTRLALTESATDSSPIENLSPTDWEWLQLDPQCMPRWIPQGDGTYELQLLSSTHHATCVENLPDVQGYGTSDVCEWHPTKPNLWRLVGRTDDVIVLGSGEKTVPIQQELHITAHPYVSGALMFGRGHLQVGMLVEPQPAYAVAPGDTNALTEFRNAIWLQVEEANRLAPAFSRIFKEMIIMTDPAKPLSRAAKGTIIRKATLAQYDDEINALYDLVESSKDTSGVQIPNSWTESHVQVWLQQHVALINQTVPGLHEDLFEHGFDSLNATFLRNRIIGALRDSSDPVASSVAQHVQPNFIYTNSTLASLAAAVVQLVHPDEAATSKAKASNDVMKDMIAKYIAKLPRVPETLAARADSRAMVVLTGSTGGLGSHILADLLADDRVARVYALNRGKGLLERQKAVFEEAGLPMALLQDEKLILLSGELTREDFGLDLTMVNEIRTLATHIIHNAWRVDFNLALGSFEPQIDATVRLINLVPSARFLFTSSVSVAGVWDASRGPVPEAPLNDPGAVIPGLGYGQSKFVVEEILGAAHEAGIQAATLRVGQICGTTASGSWHTSDWVPALVKSSISLQGLPQLKGLVSWLPSDAVSRAVVDTMLTSELPSTVNVSHPRPVPWDEVSDAFSRALGMDLPSVPMEEWIKRLEVAAKDASADDMETTPAIKLLGFFRGVYESMKMSTAYDFEVGGLPIFATEKLQSVSDTLARMPQLDDAHVQAWIGYWRSKDFIN